MLRALAVRDFVIVERIELETGPGFTVLTGETGAGKSILIDALQLALGQRGDAGVVREGAARAEISAEFDRPAERMGSERDSLHARISSHLTPAQRDRFDRMLRDRFPGMIHGLSARPDRAVPGRGGESR